MKNFYLFFIVLFTFTGFNLFSQEINASSQDKMMIGSIAKSDFMQEPYVNWYEDEYQNYTLDVNTLFTLKKHLDNVKIKVFFGSWCSDSRREVPRFIKMLDYMGFNYKNVEFIALDRSKTAPGYQKNIFNIQYVPTFIFFKNGKELGRIIETPEISLEKDMAKILK